MKFLSVMLLGLMMVNSVLGQGQETSQVKNAVRKIEKQELEKAEQELKTAQQEQATLKAKYGQKQEDQGGGSCPADVAQNAAKIRKLEEKIQTLKGRASQGS